MNYPVEILPNPNYKKIDCDLSNHFLIRHINIPVEENLIDPETNIIFKKYICHQSDHIDDLSTSLLGVFKVQNIHITFTEVGAKYYEYCEPNEEVEVPIYEIDFYIEENRKCWFVLINNLHNKKFAYNVGEDALEATCIILHTPAKWNFWHFSLRWVTDAGPLENMELKDRKKVAKRIGHSAIVAICQTVMIEIPKYQELSHECYRVA